MPKPSQARRWSLLALFLAAACDAPASPNEAQDTVAPAPDVQDKDTTLAIAKCKTECPQSGDCLWNDVTKACGCRDHADCAASSTCSDYGNCWCIVPPAGSKGTASCINHEP